MHKKLSFSEQNSLVKCGLCTHFKKEENLFSRCNLSYNTLTSAQRKCKKFYQYDEVEEKINKKAW